VSEANAKVEVRKKSDIWMEEVSQLTAMPVRVIPFDLGCPISEAKEIEIQNFVGTNFHIWELSGRTKSILSDRCIAFFTVSEHERIYYFVFKNGICVCTFVDEKTSIIEDKEFFSIEYCAKRQESHDAIFDWTHPISNHISETIESLRRIVHRNEKSIRPSGLNSFEYKGLSYVMTLSLFSYEQEHINDRARLPGWLKNNITCLLDPEILFLEDSRYFAHSSGGDRQAQRKIIESLEPIEHRDYDVRPHLSTFISWSAVLVMGNISECDIEEYTALEIELQKNWYYIYCIEKALQFENTGKIEGTKLRKLKYELELYENRLRQFEDSSLPSRFLQIQEGLLETSGILTNLNRVQRKLDCLIETAAFENQVKQKKFSQTSEILLFIIAYIQIAPIVYEYLNAYLGPRVTTFGLLAVALAGAALLILKNR
jgi:hypothetical protein